MPISISSKHFCDLQVIPGWSVGRSFIAKVAYNPTSERKEFAYGIASLYFRMLVMG